jgi:stringent starvation protein B
MATTPPIGGEGQGSSTRPYLIRALHDWCTDNGFTPYVAVFVDASVQVPQEYVKNNEIVLNVGFEATSGLNLGNEHIEFKARFGGATREIVVPIDHVVAIYARENGQGMAFPVPSAPSGSGPTVLPAADPGQRSAPRLAAVDAPAVAPVTPAGRDAEPPEPPPAGPRPALKRIK